MKMLGIDLGSSKIRAFYFDEQSGKPECIRFQGGDYLPLTLNYRGKRLLLGNAALAQAENNSEQVLFNLDIHNQGDMTLLLHGLGLSPADLFTHILENVRQALAEQTGYTQELGAFFVASVFDRPEISEMLLAAASRAGFAPCRIISSAVAAAAGYNLLLPGSPRSCLYFDMGASRSEAAVLNIDQQGAAKGRIGGETLPLGGRELDAVVYALLEKCFEQQSFELKEEFMTALNISPQEAQSLMRRLRFSEAERIRRHLDKNQLFEEDISFSFENFPEPLVVNCRISQTEYLEGVRPVISRLLRMLKNACPQPEALDQIIFVGGCSKENLIRQTLRQVLPQAPILEDGPCNSANALGKGACLLANQPSDKVIREIRGLRHDFGLLLNGSRFEPIFGKGTELPANRKLDLGVTAGASKLRLCFGSLVNGSFQPCAKYTLDAGGKDVFWRTLALECSYADHTVTATAAIPQTGSQHKLVINLQEEGGKNEEQWDIVLAVDASSSMERSFPQLMTGCRQIIGAVAGKVGRLAVVSFADQARVACDWSGEAGPLISAIASLSPGGHSNLAAGLQRSLELILAANRSGGDAAVILVTDGECDDPRQAEAAARSLREEHQIQLAAVATSPVAAHLLYTLSNGHYYQLNQAAAVSQIFAEPESGLVRLEDM